MKGSVDKPELQIDHQQALLPLLSQFQRRHKFVNMLRSLRRGTHKPRYENPDRVAKYDLRYILQATREFLAVNPRDKIYGVLGMTHEDSRQHILPKNGYADELELKIVEVFRDATRVLLLNERTTEAYTYLPVGRRIRFKESFPSWIPNFAVSLERPPFMLPVVGQLQNWRTLHQHRAEDIEFVDGGDKLRVSGLVLDTIEHITKAPPAAPRTNPLRTVSQVITSWLIYLRKYYNTPGPPFLVAFVNLVRTVRMRPQVIGFCQALINIGKWPAWQKERACLKEPAWKTLLISESNEDKYKDEAACQEKFDALMAISQSFVHTEKPGAWFVDPERLGIYFHKFNQTNPLKGGIQETFVEGRYFFGGKEWYGVGEGDVKAGDQLALLFPDANVPFILREKDGSYEMIGMAYVPEEAKNTEAASRSAEFKKLILV